MGSADDFEKLARQLNPAGTAFSERLSAASREFNALQAIERQLKADEAQFNSIMASLRQSLEGTARSLTAVHAKRARLAKELAACDADIVKLEATKEKTTAQINRAASERASHRERKLSELTGNSLAQRNGTAASSSAPVGDLLGSPTTSGGADGLHAPVDLLGINTSASEDLLAISGGGSSGGGGSALDLLVAAGLSTASAPPRPSAASSCSGAAGDRSEGYGSFDVGATTAAARVGGGRSPAQCGMPPPAAGKTLSGASLTSLSGRSTARPMSGGGGGPPMMVARRSSSASGAGASSSSKVTKAASAAVASKDPFASLHVL